jgi:hypothetical protein
MDGCAMNPSYLPALAALAGSAIGGLTSFTSAWLTQRRQDRSNRLSRDKARRQKLYKQFIDEASKLYADALVHDQGEVSALVSVYALIGRMRVLSNSAVIEKAEAVVRIIIDTYFAPNKTFPELRDLINSRSMDPLRAFSEECRRELHNLDAITSGRRRQGLSPQGGAPAALFRPVLARARHHLGLAVHSRLSHGIPVVSDTRYDRAPGDASI